MIKYAFVIAHLFGFLSFGIFMDDGVIIQDNTPTTLAPGEEKVVEITINKGEVDGFAKLQIELPEGMTASAVQTEGASFTFSDQKIKFIWMALPDNQEFSVSYTLTAATSATGNKAISGTFSYIKESQRVDYELPTKVVEISGESAASVTSETPEFTVPVDGMACVRTITEMGGGEYLVTLDFVNTQLDGFAKVKEKVPTGYTVSEDDSDGALVTIDDSGIKYIWFDAPQTDRFSISYRLSGDTQTPEIDGVFSFVENNAPREMNVIDNGVIMAETLASVEETEVEDTTTTEEVETSTPEEAVAVVEPEVESTETEIEEVGAASIADVIPEETTVETTTPVEPETVAEVETATPDVSGTGTSVPNPETGVTYKVQIVAAHKVVGSPYFKSRHGFDENFDIENHEGWVKYTTGGHSAYKQARDDRERIRTRYNFQGPFVTAYNEGDRITVQEALMITKQKWFK
ncbi:MAG: hypothetical protein P8O05_07165 [Flavobacteriales bacterium]|nr:hypothetical protein [Flavobacteriales bacterium]